MAKRTGTGASTRVRIKMADGSTVWGTLTFLALYKLRSARRADYEAYNAVMRKKRKEFEELDIARLLYTAYACAAVMDGTEAEGVMGFEEFLGEVTPNRREQAWAIDRLLTPKAAGDSKRRSESGGRPETPEA